MMLIALAATALVAAVGGAFIGAALTDRQQQRRGDRYVRIIGLRRNDHE